MQLALVSRRTLKREHRTVAGDPPFLECYLEVVPEIHRPRVNHRPPQWKTLSLSRLDTERVVDEASRFGSGQGYGRRGVAKR